MEIFIVEINSAEKIKPETLKQFQKKEITDEYNKSREHQILEANIEDKEREKWIFANNFLENWIIIS